ncbi:homoserine O-acetyltransferase [Alphaproteobacteria bacterium]|nr:homoserine O-acetyltransferase [Alphaproteobacteria bacterium]
MYFVLVHSTEIHMLYHKKKNNIYNFIHKPSLSLKKKFVLQSGAVINNPTIAYKTYGKLNKKKSNAILICHALTGDQYVAGDHPVTRKKGWWNDLIGKGKVFDTDKYFLISSNVLGGCMGTTGPNALNPTTNKAYGLEFPEISIKDMVSLQVELINNFNIEKLFCVVGGSMGGMQVLEWGINYSHRVKLLIPIATSYRHTAQNIAFHEAGRQAIKADPDWNQGNYINSKSFPKKGLAAARSIAHITYMSEEHLETKFGRAKNKKPLSQIFEGSFEVENYLQYQGISFVERFDANSYLYLTRSMDRFDLSERYQGKLEKSFLNNLSRWLLVSFTSDWLFPASESRLIVNALMANACDVSFVDINSNRGHDSFLVNVPRFYKILKGFLSGAKL